MFSIKDLGHLDYFLGIEVGYEPQGIVLSQNKFTRDLRNYSFDLSTKDVTPLPLNLKLQSDLHNCSFDLSMKDVTPLPLKLKLQSDDGALLDDPKMYRSLVGKLNYLTNTRPNLCYAVQVLSQYMQMPRVSHLRALIHTLRYVFHTVG